MGTGLVAAAKLLAPMVIYIVGVFLFFAALSGRGRWTLLFVAFLIPLRNVIDRLHQFPGGTKFLTILVFAMVVGWIFLGMSGRIQFMERSSLNGIIILLIFYMFISLQVGNQYLGTSFFNIGDPRVQDWKNFCMMPMLYFITANIMLDKKWVWRLFAVMCFAMFVAGYYTSTQVSWFSSLVSRVKISGTFQFLGPNEVAAFFNQYTMILISVFFAMKAGKNKLMLLGLILINLFCVVFLYSRAAYLGTVLGLCILFAFRNKKLLIPIFLMAVFWQAVLPEKAIQRIEGTTDEYGELESSAARRLSIWEISYDHFEKSPVVGIGYGVFRHLGLDLGDTHNIYLKLLVEQGLVGLLLFLVLCLCFIKEGWRLYRRGDEHLSRALGFGLVVATFVMMVNNIFGNRFTYFELGAYQWIFAGLVTRLNVLSDQARLELAKVQKKPKKSRRRNV